MIARTLSLIALCCVATSAAVNGQAPPAPTTVEVRPLAFNAQLREREAWAHDPAAADAPAVSAPIKTYLNHESATLELRGRNIVFTTSPDRESITRAGEVIGRATLPAGTRSAILLFLPNAPDADAKANVMVIPDSRSEFPSGSFRVSNLSAVPVQIKLEDKDYNFQPGQTRVISDAPMRENQHAGMLAFAFIDNQPRRIASGLWPNPGDRRVVQILYQHPVTGQVQLAGFDDIPPLDPAP